VNSGRIGDFAVVDMAHPCSLASRGARTLALSEVGRAFRNPGFFFLTNHGVAAERIEGTFEEARQFYALPDEDKSALTCSPASQFLGYRGLGAERSRMHRGGEACEQYRLGNAVPGPTTSRLLDRYNGPFPAGMGLFRDLVGVSDRLMAMCAGAAGLSASFLAPLTRAPLHRLGLNCYRVGAGRLLGNSVAYSMTPHVDHAIFTIVVQDELGLQVLDARGTWIDVPIVDGALFCFIGDYFQRWTNGLYPATRHRVRDVDRDRMSIQYKHKPPHATIVEPLEPFVSDDRARQYDAFETGEQYLVLLEDLLAPPGMSEFDEGSARSDAP
jgi:isopenicillin N synthase-like dioxygenase